MYRIPVVLLAMLVVNCKGVGPEDDPAGVGITGRWHGVLFVDVDMTAPLDRVQFDIEATGQMDTFGVYVGPTYTVRADFDSIGSFNGVGIVDTTRGQPFAFSLANWPELGGDSTHFSGQARVDTLMLWHFGFGRRLRAGR